MGFSEELFFGWYALLQITATQQGKIIVVTQTGEITNWTLETLITVKNLSPDALAYVGNESGTSLNLAAAATGSVVKAPTQYKVEWDNTDLLNSNLRGYISSLVARTYKLGILVETITMVTTVNVVNFVITNQDYDEIRFDVNYALLVNVRNELDTELSVYDNSNNVLILEPFAGHPAFYKMIRGANMGYIFTPAGSVGLFVQARFDLYLAGVFVVSENAVPVVNGQGNIVLVTPSANYDEIRLVGI